MDFGGTAAEWGGRRSFKVRWLNRGSGRFQSGGRCGRGTEQVVLHRAVVSATRSAVAGADRGDL